MTTLSSIRCPRGHSWDPAEFDDDPSPAPGPLACPFCGALCSSTLTPADSLAPTVVSADDADAPPKIPGYEILGLLGRGGMGVVLKARQVRTDRVVALKVPGHLDLETRARFTTEAQAAARVSHPNIVQVYEVGEHQGRPFLALEYVPGGTLADRLTGTPLPPRPAASLTMTLARAVGAAHAHGVVHRDLKPANILLQNPDALGLNPRSRGFEVRTGDRELGAIKVADFGLARRLDIDTGQTRSGTILGTPDYMAPEQAAGDSHGVGPPADVWALGAILYELLTGRSPFRGAGMLDTLDQVRTHDPVAPRRLVPGVPRDLETICLKCLHKDPARRYPEAGELADDLGRFLDGQPVRARPVSMAERWVKRARRNPAAAGLAAGLFLVLIAAAAYGVVYHLRLQAQRDRARYHFEIAVKSIEGLLTTEVSDDGLALEPQAELKRKELLEKALAFYEELRQVEPDDPDLAWLAARGAVRVGDIHRLIGRHAEAVAAYEGAIGRLDPLKANPPAGADPDREIAYCHTFIGECHRLRGDPTTAAAAYQQALDIQQSRVRDHPDYRQDLSRTRYNLGIVARQTGRPTVAVAELKEAARLLDGVPADDLVGRRHLARVYVNLGPAYRATRQFAEAEEACGRAVELFAALVDRSDGRPDLRRELAVAHINRGLVRQSAGNPVGARADLVRAEGLLADLVDLFRSIPLYRAERARAYNARAAVAFDAGDPTEGTDLFCKAVEVWTGLVAERDSPDHHGELGIAQVNLGRALYHSDTAWARQLLTDGLAELLIGLKANPKDPHFYGSVRDLVGLLVWAGDHAGARAVVRRVAASLPDQALAVHRATALLSLCVQTHLPEPTALLAGGAAAIEADAYEQLAVELVTAAGPAAWPAVVADPDCAALLARPGFAKAVGR